ncbi:terminase large subunit [Schleiferilactobacillus harbinensis]|uniref:terminase large subunit n=1 Tax=Schleiferilactobacillus harbinensis TaxID=304207 RepID=UPI00116CAC95|nr:terminase TerL endonuclease subunit [Schleiferilactobacillus harbinensis]GEK06145.1 terminase [Schleiferilactobacillus harbinensis]
MIEPNVNYADEFAQMVSRNGKAYPTSIKKAVRRYKKWKKRKDIWWDNDKANAMMYFVEHFVRHVKGELAGQLVRLEPWEKFGYAQMYGWQHKNEKGRTVRVIREVYWQVPKKNGKTLIGIGAMAYAMYGGEEFGADIYCAASSYDQAQYAAIPFALTIQNSEPLYKNTQIYKGKKDTIQGATYRYTVGGISYRNTFQVMTKAASKIEGSNPYFVLNDELHSQDNMDQYDNFKSAMIERDQPMMFNISTAGKGSTSVGMRVYHESRDILDNDNDDTRLVLIYEPNKGYDWTDRNVWKMVNPNFGVSISMSGLENEFKSAQRSAHGKGEFLAKHLDVFVNGTDTFFDQQELESILKPEEMGDLEGEPCWLGLDLSKTTDLTCVSLNFPTNDENGHALLKVRQRYFIPTENLDYREKQDNVPYRDLAERGFVEFCDGKMIDQDQVVQYITDCMGKYDVQQLNYDPAMAQRLVELCENLGLECIAVSQYPSVMNEVVDDTERLVYEHRLITDNPLLLYCLSNVVVVTNISGLKVPSKRQSKKKIDGAAAMMIAHKATISQMDEINPDDMADYIKQLYS